jgi:hypothetical protein
MKYVQPYGVTDEDAPYVNGDPSLGRQGSIPPAAAFESPMREIVGVISKSGWTPDDGDLLQMAKSIRSQRMNYAVDTGAVNEMVVALDPVPEAYTPGLPLRVKVLHTNTSTTVTLDAGIGPQPVKKMDGSDPGIGDLPAGGVIEVTFDSTHWQLVNFGGAGGGPGSIYYIKIPYCVDSSVTPNTIDAAFSPAITSLTAGDIIMVKVANTVTGATNIVVNALASKPVKVLGGGGNLLQGDIAAGDVVLLEYDGVNFYVAPNLMITADTILNVPSGYATGAAAMTALQRKRIALGVTVTLQLAAGVYQPFAINHQDGDRIVVKGTMLGATPVVTDFVRTGITPTQRANDTNTNLTLLRARYGTEIRVDFSRDMSLSVPGWAVGITNIGTGCPTVQDILITGDTTPGENGFQTAKGNGEIGLGVYLGRAINAANVATCLLGCGLCAATGSRMATNACIAIGNSEKGFYSTQGSSMKAENSLVFNGGYFGMLAGFQSFLEFSGSTVSCNNNQGITAQGQSNATGAPVTVSTHGAEDLNAYQQSLIQIRAGYASYSTLSPSPINTVGNQNSLIVDG